MLVLAHRGYHARAPENTLAAFAAAVELGVDGIETDVRLSRDGLPVIIHDRVTPRNRAIADLTHREIEADVGHPVPVLAEILDAFPDVLWNIEIKSPQAWPVAAPILACYQSKRRLFVTSFWHHVVKRCAEALAIDCGLLMAHRPLDVGAVMATCAEQPRIRSIVWDYNIVDESVVKAVVAGGWGNVVYGAVTPAEHRQCAGLGLVALITDYPPLALGRAV